MIIKINDSELEISNNSEVYLGSKKTGQIFKNWGDLNETSKKKLCELQAQAQILVNQSREILIGADVA